MRLSRVNDQDYNKGRVSGDKLYSMYADFKNEDEMDSFVEFLNKHELSYYLKMMCCVDVGYGDKVGDTIYSESYDTKEEFTKDVRVIVRDFKKSLT